MSLKRARPAHCRSCSHIFPLFLTPSFPFRPSSVPPRLCQSRRPLRISLPKASVSSSPNFRDVDERILRAVDTLSRQDRITVPDVAAASGADISATQDALVTLANLTGAAIDVTDAGTLAYRFPRDVRARLRSNSFRAALRMAWQRAFPALFTAVRVLFGALLILSIVITFVAIAALSSASRSDDDRRSSRSTGYMPVRFFAPDVFDIMFYSRYRRMYHTAKDPDEMSFLEAVYSFVFGDGDPNQGLDERRWRRVAATIRANRGAVTAEQLAPFLNPPPVRNAEDVLVDESFMLPALQRFQGHPEVTDDGDIVYVFPSFAETGARVPQVEIAGRGGEGAVLVEKELKLTRSPMGQRALVVALGLVNVLGVLTLGVKLGSVTAMTPDAAAFIGFVRGVYPALAAYAASFVFIPLARWWRQMRVNREIRERNEARVAAAEAVARGSRAVRRKLSKAEEFKQRVKVVGGDDVVYSSDKDLLDQRKVQENVLDEFDRRLGG